MAIDKSSSQATANWRESGVKVIHPYKSVTIWDVDTGYGMQTLADHTSFVSSVKLSKDGKLIVSGSNDKTVRAWNSETGENVWQGSHGCLIIWEIQQLPGQSYIERCAITPDGKTAVSAGKHDGGGIALWDLAGEYRSELSGERRIRVSKVWISPDGNKAACCLEDDTISVWDLQSETILGVLRGHHESLVFSLEWSSDGSKVVTGDLNGNVKVWDALDKFCEKTKLAGHSYRYVSAICIAANGLFAASSTPRETIIWNLMDGTALAVIPETQSKKVLSFSSDSRFLAFCTPDNSVSLWDIASSSVAKSLEGHAKSVSSISFSSDGLLAASADDAGYIMIWVAEWDANTGSLLSSTTTKYMMPTQQSTVDPDDATIMSPEEGYNKAKALFDQGRWEDSLPLFTRSANQGHVESMKYLAICHDSSHLDNEEVRNMWISKRDELLKDPEGMCAHAHALRAAGEHIEAIAWFRNAADKGNFESQYQLGVYLRKVGDGAEAMVWFEKAGEGGYELAEVALAEGYEQGIGVPRDAEKASKWRQKIFERVREHQQSRADIAISAAIAATTSSAKGGNKSVSFEALSKDYKEAVRLHEWGSWVKGIQIMERLRKANFTDALNYMDPITSPLKNPTGMFWMAAHFEDEVGDTVVASAWYGRAVARGGKVPPELEDALGALMMPEVKIKRSQDRGFQDALANLGWGYYSKGFDGIEKLAEEGYAAAKALLDPTRSALRNPAAMTFLADRFADRADALRCWVAVLGKEGPEKDEEYDDNTDDVVGDGEKVKPKGDSFFFQSVNENAAGQVIPDGLVANEAFDVADESKTKSDDENGVSDNKSGDGPAQAVANEVAADDKLKNEEEERQQTKEKIQRLEALVQAWRIRAEQVKQELITGSITPLTIAMSLAPKTSESPSSTNTTNTKPPASTFVASPSIMTIPQQDAEYKDAIGNIAWGRYAKGIQSLIKLSKLGHRSSLTYLDPSQSTLKDPNCMHMLGLHFQGEVKATRAKLRAKMAVSQTNENATEDEPGNDATEQESSSSSSLQPDICTEVDGKSSSEKSDETNSMEADQAAALGWFRKAAEAGNHRSMVSLGRMVAEGEGCPKDPWQSIGWYTKAWEIGGNPDAAYEMGKAYAHGVYVFEEVKPKNGSQASPQQQQPPQKPLIVTATTRPSSSTPTKVVTPSSIPPHLSVASHILQHEVILSRSSTTVTPPRSPITPTSPVSPLQPSPKTPASSIQPQTPPTKRKTIVKQDDQKALEWLRKAVARDQPYAYNLLGEYIREGRGVQENSVLAVEYFKKAANAGVAVAMYNLGSALLNGTGIHRDETAALLWLTRAAKVAQEE
ncbi:hypothetical protein HDU76_000623 [Blyttiomyces sp. JEL0837]|nr:hypothetical protein HDU76_000623 [Blyttiomyces sp. JEL0837]